MHVVALHYFTYSIPLMKKIWEFVRYIYAKSKGSHEKLPLCLKKLRGTFNSRFFNSETAKGEHFFTCKAVAGMVIICSKLKASLQLQYGKCTSPEGGKFAQV
jgi:hypothetical protein